MKDLIELLKARVRQLLGTPAGRPTWIVCIHCLTTHIDQGIWIYREHKTHLCLKCGELIKVPFKEPTRGVAFQ